MEENFAISRTREYFDSFMVEERLIDSVVPDTGFSLFGREFATPVMTPAFSHLKTFVKERPNGMLEYSIAAKLCGAVNFVGMCENSEFEELLSSGAATIRIVKPYADKDKVISQLTFAEQKGAFAVGMDIDHIFGSDGQFDVVMGEPMTGQSRNDMREYCEVTKLPFVVKGVLSLTDTIRCGEAGASAILVSHHHGRLPFAVPPLVLLPEIAKKAKEYGMKVFVDCGVDTGYDAFKAIALGADAVCAGRILMPAIAKEGTGGVEKQLRKMTEELRYTMAFSGFSRVEEINSSVLHRYF